MSIVSQRFPATSIHVTLQAPGDDTLDAMREPSISKKLIIPLLVKKELMVSAKRGVDFTMPVKVGSMEP